MTGAAARQPARHAWHHYRMLIDEGDSRTVARHHVQQLIRAYRTVPDDNVDHELSRTLSRFMR